MMACPVEGGSIEEYRKGKNSSKITKIWDSMNKRETKSDLKNSKYLNLVKELGMRRK